jgi:hypothetical protein
MSDFVRIKNVVLRKDGIEGLGMAVSLKGKRIFPVIQIFMSDGTKQKTMELLFSDVEEMGQCFADTVYDLGITNVSSREAIDDAKKMFEESIKFNEKVLDQTEKQ